MSTQNEALSIAAQKVLEEWAMMLVDPSDNSEPEAVFEDTSLFESSVIFNGAKKGKLSIIAPKGFLAQLSDNLLGEEEKESLGCSADEDGFKEMANVLTGNYLTEAFGNQLVFDLMSPQFTTIDLSAVSDLTQSNETVFFLADDLPVVVTCRIDNE